MQYQTYEWMKNILKNILGFSMTTDKLSFIRRAVIVR